MSSSHRHIQVLEENQLGTDFSIGDLHGCLDPLLMVLKEGNDGKPLGEHDRLFIAGDIVDRGDQNRELLDFLRNHEASGKLPRIFVARGDHEDMFINPPDRELHAFHQAVLDEGDTKIGNRKIFGYTPRELVGIIMEGHDLSKPNNARKQKEYIALLESLPYNYYKNRPWTEYYALAYSEYRRISDNGQGWIYQLNEQEHARYSNQLERYPYIIHVKGAKPFNVVHAEMPLTDEELQKRIQDRVGLNPAEIFHAIWARQSGNQQKVRDLPSNHVTVCGHSIDDGPRVRSKHVNLDIGTYDKRASSNGPVAVYNHRTGRCTVLGKQYANAIFLEKLNKFEKKTNGFLKKIHPNAVADAKESKRIPDLAQWTILSATFVETKNPEEKAAAEKNMVAIAARYKHKLPLDYESNDKKTDLLNLAAEGSALHDALMKRAVAEGRVAKQSVLSSVAGQPSAAFFAKRYPPVILEEKDLRRWLKNYRGESKIAITVDLIFILKTYRQIKLNKEKNRFIKRKESPKIGLVERLITKLENGEGSFTSKEIKRMMSGGLKDILYQFKEAMPKDFFADEKTASPPRRKI